MLSEKSAQIRGKKAIKITSLVNWFYGNFFTRKCSDNIQRQAEHWKKLQLLAQKLKGTEMTHKAFFRMMRGDKTICTLGDGEWRKNKCSWRSTDGKGEPKNNLLNF